MSTLKISKIVSICKQYAPPLHKKKRERRGIERKRKIKSESELTHIIF